MKRSLKKYVSLATCIAVVWVGLLGYAYIHFTAQSEVVTQEILENSRNIGEQVNKIFSWFDQKQEVFVTGAQNFDTPLPRATATINGKSLTLAVPVELAKQVENQFARGITLRFVSNNPKNAANVPLAHDNAAMMNMAAQGQLDSFSYNSSDESYHYVRPFFATSSCLSCHIGAEEGELLGAVVVDTNPTKFILSQREERLFWLFVCIVASTVAIALLYLFLVRLWRKSAAQGENLEYAQNMLANMNHETEVLLGNVSRVIKELQFNETDPQKAELLQRLQSMSNNLLQSSSKLREDGSSIQVECQEEIFHVDSFFKQCLQMFETVCAEKGLDLQLQIENSVPNYVLGDAFHLRQVLVRILKESTSHTDMGSVAVTVSATDNMASRINVKSIDNPPIHLLVKVENTGKGFIVSDKQFSSAQAAAEGSKKFHSRPVISLKPLNEIAALFYGNVHLSRNSASGSCFDMLAQVKLVQEDIVRQSVPTQEGLQQATQGLEQAKQGVQSLSQGLQQAEQSLPQMQHVAGIQEAKQGMQQVTHGIDEAKQGIQNVQQTLQRQSQLQSVQGAGQRKAASKTTKAIPMPLESHDERMQTLFAKPEDAQEYTMTMDDALKIPLSEEQGRISIIIGDSEISEFTDEAKQIFAEANFDAHLMSSADEIFRAVDVHNHNYAVVFLRVLNDLEVVYTATRIRYLERLGSKPVAIVLMAENIIQADMDVLRYFNVSTVDNFPRDAAIAVKITHLALRTKGNQIFQGGKVFNAVAMDKQNTQIFDLKQAMEISHKDKSLIQSMCAMWVRFYPAQVARLREFIREGNEDNLLRLLRSIKNSAGTVCLPLLWHEASRLEKKLSQGEEVRYEKLLAVYEQTYMYLKDDFDWDEE